MPENYHVIILPRALSDIQEITRYIRTDSPQNAVDVATAILDIIQSLARLPGRFPQIGRSRARRTTVHAVPVSGYIVTYRVKSLPAVVHILHVRRGARRR